MGNTQAGQMKEGLYYIKTIKTHKYSHTDRGLTVGIPDYGNYKRVRNDNSGWVATHADEKYGNTIWKVQKGKLPDTWRIIVYQGPPINPTYGIGWGLSGWMRHAYRNGSSAWVAAHSGDYWPMDWKIVPESKYSDEYRILTTAKPHYDTPENMGLALWNTNDGYRTSSSSRVAIHTGNDWPVKWKFIPYDSHPGTSGNIPSIISNNNNDLLKIEFQFQAARLDPNNYVSKSKYKFRTRFYQGADDILNRTFNYNDSRVTWSSLQNGYYTVVIKPKRDVFKRLWENKSLNKTLRLQVEIEISDSNFTKLTENQKIWKSSISKDVIFDPFLPTVTDLFYFKTSK